MPGRASTRNGPEARRLAAVVVGASAGGLQAVCRLLGALPASFAAPVIVVQHLHARQDDFLVGWLDGQCALAVREAADKRAIAPGGVWLAPPGYHLLIEREGSFALSIDARVSWARPSIDVAFESAAHVWRRGLVAVLLTGGNADGTAGLERVRALGGLALVQDPATAEHPAMPRAAIAAGAYDQVLSIPAIAALLVRLTGVERDAAHGPAPTNPDNRD